MCPIEENAVERKFRGVWIPAEVWLATNLSALDKLLFAEIDSIGGRAGCYASNAYLAAWLGCSQRTVSAGVARLIEAGFVEVVKFDGRRRTLRSRLANFARQDRGLCEAKKVHKKGCSPFNGPGARDGGKDLEEFWNKALERSKREYPQLSIEDVQPD